MADQINPSSNFPICDAVIYGGSGKRILETVLVPQKDGEPDVVPGGAGPQMQEICSQIDEVLGWVNADKTAVVSMRLFLQDVNRDIKAVNEVYQAYFGSHTLMRIAVGCELQGNMLVECAITCEVDA